MEQHGSKKRLGSMLAVDFRRMFTSRYFYILLGVALVIPVLVLGRSGHPGAGAGHDHHDGRLCFRGPQYGSGDYGRSL